MPEMSTSLFKRIARALVFTLLLVCSAIAIDLWRQVRSAADLSAHSALTAEICNQLASVTRGQRYPDTLSQLALTYPDGGNASLLRRFDYHSTDTHCTLRTVLHGRDLVYSFP